MVIYILAIISVITFGCAKKVQVATENLDKHVDQTVQTTKQESVPVYKNYLSPKPKIVKRKIFTKIKKYDIFKNKFFTFSANNAPLTTVLYAISRDTGLNIVISPEVDTSKTVTANFNNTPLKYALDIIMNITGLYYEVKGNILYIKELKTKVFKIPYIYSSSKYNAQLGGDVLGSSMSMGLASGGAGGVGGNIGAGSSLGGTTGGLTGNYSIEYKTPEESLDFYSIVEKDITTMLSEKGKYTFNKATGILIITDKIKNIQLISKYIQKIKKEVQKQVLIEAKIIEVELSKEYQFGVDWSVLVKDLLDTGANLTIGQTLSLQNGVGAISIQGSNFSTLINALQRVGNVKTLANPRLRVLNGQSALISTGRIIPFWEKQIQTLAAQFATQQITYIRTSVLDGILLGVTVHINDNGEVIMNVVPVSAKLEGTKQFKQNNEVVAEAPILNVKETGTVIKAKDGDMIIIGGLISEDNKKIDESVPKLSSLKMVGGIFKKKNRKKVKKELIIFLRPKIVEF